MCLGVVGQVSAALDWFNTVPVRFQPAGDPLPAHETNWMEACFLQLVFSGANQTNNPAISEGQGVTGDDEVRAWSFFGQGDDLYAENPGILPSQLISSNLVDGGFYFTRIWSAPTPDFAQGLVPVSATNRYVDSALWQYISTSPPAPNPEFNFGGSGLATTFIPCDDQDGDGIPDWWEFLYFGGLTNAVAGADGDSDFQSNYNEFRAGTDPTNSLSVFEIEASVMVGESMVLEWSSVSGRTYAVSVSTNLLESFEPVWTNLPSAPPVNSWTASWPGVERAFFAVEVE